MEVSYIDLLKAKLDSEPLHPTTWQSWCDQFNLDFTYNSCAIENNTLDMLECKIILEDGIAIGGKSIREHLEVINHREAITYIEEYKHKVLSEQIIKNIHFLVLNHQREHAGAYRREPVRIAGSNIEPTRPFLIKQTLDDLFTKYHNDWAKEHILARIAAFHLEFERIHPFIDGNGRTGRLIINFELLKNGYLPLIIKFEDRAKYYKAFEEYHQNNTCAAMLEIILSELHEQYESLLSLIDSAWSSELKLK